MTERLRHTPCPVCQGPRATRTLEKGSYAIYTCMSCEAQFVAPRPSIAELNAFYNQPQYYSESEFGYTDYMGEENLLRTMFRRRLTVIQQLIGKPGRLADLGCAAGFFLDEAQQAGWFATGTELSASMRTVVRERFGLYVSPTGDEFRSESFDVITMWEYIEHLIDPLAELQRAAGWLKPGGLVCISTPNTAHLQAVLHPADWWEYKPPAHLTFFTSSTITRLLERAGFSVMLVCFEVPMLPVSGFPLFDGLSSVRHLVGDRLMRKTPLWWSYSLLRRAVQKAATIVLPDEKICIGMDIYAQKTI